MHLNIILSIVYYGILYINLYNTGAYIPLLVYSYVYSSIYYNTNIATLSVTI